MSDDHEDEFKERLKSVLENYQELLKNYAPAEAGEGDFTDIPEDSVYKEYADYIQTIPLLNQAYIPFISTDFYLSHPDVAQLVFSGSADLAKKVYVQ